VSAVHSIATVLLIVAAPVSIIWLFATGKD
jgi:hypothetical protein